MQMYASNDKIKILLPTRKSLTTLGRAKSVIMHLIIEITWLGEEVL